MSPSSWGGGGDRRGRGWGFHSDAGTVLRRRGARRHRYDRRLGCLPGRGRSALGVRRHRCRLRRDGADRRPARPRAAIWRRGSSSGRHRPGGTLPLPRHHLPQCHRRDGDDPVRLDLCDLKLDDPADPDPRRARRGPDRAALPAVAAEHGEPGDGGRARDTGARGRRPLPPGPGPRHRPSGDHDRDDPQHRAPDRPRRHRASADQAAPAGDAGSGRGRHRCDLAWHRARLRQLSLAALRTRLAGQLLRRRHRLFVLPALGAARALAPLAARRSPPGACRCRHRAAPGS